MKWSFGLKNHQYFAKVHHNYLGRASARCHLTSNQAISPHASYLSCQPRVLNVGFAPNNSQSRNENRFSNPDAKPYNDDMTTVFLCRHISENHLPALKVK